MNAEERSAYELLLRHRKPFQRWQVWDYNLILIEDAIRAVIEASRPAPDPPGSESEHEIGRLHSE